MEQAEEATALQNQMQRILDNKPEPTTEQLARASGEVQQFHPGQTVQQWWASWFADAASAPLQTQEKSRGAWYSAVINGCEGRRDILYAGIQHHNVQVYHVY